MVISLREILPQKNFPESARPFFVSNYWNGEWREAHRMIEIPDPLTNECLAFVPDTSIGELNSLVDALSRCRPDEGLHNIYRNPERYALYGRIFARAAQALDDEANAKYLAELINVVMPKGMDECMAEVVVSRDFLYNLAGDGCRFLAKGIVTPGNRFGQEAHTYRWPYGPVMVVAPFNFPLEIPVLQLCGALAMGNLPVLKPDQRVAIIAEVFIRLLLACGMPEKDACLLHAGGETTQVLALSVNKNNLPVIKLSQFTGSTRVAKHLLRLTEGRVKKEDSGFDWKVLGPNLNDSDVEFQARQCAKDAYAASGQKCSAQSVMIVHKNWKKKDLIYKLAFKSLTLMPCPTLTWSDERIREHIECLKTAGGHILFGGKPLDRCVGTLNVPKQYGLYQPTAVYMPLEKIHENFELATTEVFAPVQIVTEWDDKNLELVLGLLEGLGNKLTAGIVDRDVSFLKYMLGRTNNGTTYAGILGRTTGAPQWHNFGPGGHPADAGIGTPEAICDLWSFRREIIWDTGTYEQV